jgi:hypothetical protein
VTKREKEKCVRAKPCEMFKVKGTRRQEAILSFVL